MATFGFIVHPINIEQLKTIWPLTKIMPDFMIKSFLKKLSPFKVSHIKNIRSKQGIIIDGYLVSCPLLPRQMLEMKEELVIDRIIAAGRIAENLGAQIIGLGGYTSIVGDKGYTIAKNLKAAVTSGNSFTAWSVFEAVSMMSRIKNTDLAKATVVIIGATGSIGSLCARKLSYYTPRIIITARHKEKLERLKETILHLNSIDVVIENDVHKAVKDADIVITTTSVPEALLSPEELKTNAIVCDVSVPKNIVWKNGQRPDVTIIEGGIIKLPYPVDFGVNTGLPENMIYACLSETMLLTFEERFTGYSLGDNINLNNLEEISAMAMRHGFEVWVADAHTR